MKKHILFLVMLFTVAGYSQAINVSTNAYTVPELVTDVLIDSPCAVVSNVSWNNCSNGIGYFTNTNPDFPMAAGVVMSTGFATNVPGPESGVNSDNNCGTDGDTLSSLYNYIQSLGIDPGLNSYNDVVVIEFDFLPFTNTMSFDFLFASDEYGQWQCQYADAFAFFLTNTATNVTTNLALVPGTTDPISVLTIRDDNTLNSGTCNSENAEYFGIDNQVNPANAAIDFRGQTVLMTAQSTVVPNTLYHIQLIIGDRNDNAFDSAIFIGAGSFNVGTAEISYQVDLGVETDDMLVSNGLARCPGETIELNSGLEAANYTFEWTFNGTVLSGETGPSMIADQAGTYCIAATNIGGGSCTQTDCIDVEYLPVFSVNDAPADYVVCEGEDYNFNDHIQELLGPSLDPLDYELTFYLTPEDAQEALGQISSIYPSTVSPLQVYVRIEDFTIPCPVFSEFTAMTQPCPECDIILTSATGTDNQTVCNNQPIEDIVFDITGDATNATIAGLPTGVTGSYNSGVYTITGTPTATGNYTATITTVGCSPELTYDVTINVISLPVITSLTGSTPICEGEDAIFDLEGTPNATVDYTLNSVSGTVTFTASGTAQVVVTAPTVDQILETSVVSVGTCSDNVVLSYTVVVNDLPEFTSITSNTPICEGDDAIFTFTGTPNAAIEFTVDGVSQSTTLNASGSYVYTATTPSSNVDVTMQSIEQNGCTVTLTETETVTVNSTPSLTSLSGLTPICEGQDAIFTIVGSPNAMIDYDVNGTTGTIQIEADGDVDVVVMGATVNQVITLSSIYIGTCTTALTDTFTIVVNPNPVFTSVTGNGPICQGSDATFDFVGTAGATIIFDVNGGSQTIVLDATGNGQYTEVSPSSNVVITMQSIEQNGCTVTLTETETVVVSPTPTIISLTGSTPICEGEDAIFDLEGTPNATVDYTLNSVSGTVTFTASGTAQVVVTAPTVDQILETSVVSVGTCSDNVVLSHTIVVSNALATPTITTTPPSCSAEGTATITNYDPMFTYSFTPNDGTSVGAGGVISGMVAGTNYTVTAENASGCVSAASLPFSIAAILVTPDVPTITTTPPSCSANGSSTISNYDPMFTYSFTPNDGTSVGAGGVISGMVIGTSYTVTASNGSCTSGSSLSFSNAAMLTTPDVPTITTTPPSCSAEGTATITNYDPMFTYSFTPNDGTSVGAGGVISGMVAGTNYTVTAENASGCVSAASLPFSIAAILVTPDVPTITTTPPSCSADGSSTISNYDPMFTYSFTPNDGTSVGAGGVISGMVIGTSYTVTASNGSCTSGSSLSFSNAAMLTTPDVPTITTTPPSCSANGSSTISNYDPMLTYAFTPNDGTSVGAGGVISGMVAGTNYTVTAENASGCVSAASLPFSIAAILVTPDVPTITTTPPSCSANGSSAISNYDPMLTYSFTPNDGTSVGAGGVISGMVIGTSYTVTASNGSCTSGSSLSFSNAAMLASPIFTSITSNTPICAGENAVFTFTGTANATINFTVDGTSQSAMLDASGSYVYTLTNASSNVVVTMVNIQQNTCTVTLTDSETVVVNPLPTINPITNNSAICAGENAIFTIEGTPNALVNYDINGVAGTTQIESDGDVAVVVREPQLTK
ncbi:choice-of-anchor L domain-containing protein [Flavobacterium sp.]|uniref:choice-of-anchor L domain-containing protein n=1 Tax=Flavobacterium sp. TaxID=239 RepID=UPI0035272905